MACCVINLTEKGRRGLWLSFVALSILLVAIDSGLILYALYISVFIACYIPTERAVIIFIFTIFAMSGMELISYYCLGLKVCGKSFAEAHKKHSRYLLRIWLFAGYSMVINMFVIGTMTSSVSNHITRSMHHSLERGMVLYLQDLSWKKSIDELQYKMECCGVHDYKDWHRISWLSSDMFNKNASAFQRFNHSENRIYIPVEPWSCCNISNVNWCYHDPLQITTNKFEAHTVYSKGCLDKLKEPIGTGFIFFILVSYFTFASQIALTILSRFIYSSYRNAMILNEPKGQAPGWLWGSNFDTSNILSKLRNKMVETSDSECESDDAKKKVLKKMNKFYAKQNVEKKDDVLQFSGESDFSLPEQQIKSMKIESSEVCSEIDYEERPITKITWEINEKVPVDKKPKVCPKMCKEREDALIKRDEKKCKVKALIDQKVEEIYKQRDRRLKHAENTRHVLTKNKDCQKANCYCKPNFVKNAVKKFSRRNYQTLKNVDNMSDSDCSHIPMDIEKDLFFKKM